MSKGRIEYEESSNVFKDLQPRSGDMSIGNQFSHLPKAPSGRHVLSKRDVAPLELRTENVLFSINIPPVPG